MQLHKVLRKQIVSTAEQSQLRLATAGLQFNSYHSSMSRSDFRTFQKVVEATYAVPPIPIRLEHNMMLSPLIRIAVVFG